MKSSENHVDRSWADDLVEDYVDGLLSRRQKKSFEAVLSVDEELARQVDLARRVRDTLAAIETPACPPSVYEPVLEKARRDSQGEQRSTWTDWLSGILQPGLAPVRLIVVASVVGAAILTTVVMMNQGQPRTALDEEEVQMALDEVKLALSYVSLAGRETGSTIRNRAVDENIIDPIVRAIGHAEIGSAADSRDRDSGATIEDAKKGGNS